MTTRNNTLPPQRRRRRLPAAFAKATAPKAAPRNKWLKAAAVRVRKIGRRLVLELKK